MSSIIPPETADRFSKAAMGLKDISEYQEFRNVAENIRAEWPGCKAWLEWWIFHRSAKKLFKAVSHMPEERCMMLPDSTNAQESMHHLFYMSADTDQNVLTGKLVIMELDWFWKRDSAVTTKLYRD
jgi:hypothetical protein